MKRLIFLVFLVISIIFSAPALAVENPLSVPNNKFGIHILFPEELNQAAVLINSNGGDWGYVTIPIQADDRNLAKWQAFMDSARQNHVIPIVRIATEGDYFNTKVWQKPNYNDVLDFANFLDSLSWPTKNRYVIIFNEPNRNAEWGGKADPADYAAILNYSTDVFKKLNPDFFLISAGLDNGADTNSEEINEYQFIEQVNAAVPGVFAKIDGLASHAYPNPGFSQAPSVVSNKSIASFLYEENLIENLSNKKLPVFITETGWSQDKLPESTIANYYQNALLTIWANKNIVAITPFLLSAGVGEFRQFSFLGVNEKPNREYNIIKNMPKITGEPLLTEDIVADANDKQKILSASSVINFNFHITQPMASIYIQVNAAKTFLKWLLNI